MKVKFFKADVFENSDERRVIRDVTLPEGMEIPFKVRQTKIITLSDEAVKKKLVLGNHYHKKRWEFFIVIGKKGASLFRFMFKEPGQKVCEAEVLMEAGDACLVPPGCTHACMGLESGVQLIGYSDLPYNPDDDVKDIIL